MINGEKCHYIHFLNRLCNQSNMKTLRNYVALVNVFLSICFVFIIKFERNSLP